MAEISNSFLLELAKICKAAYASPINHNRLTINEQPLKYQKIIHGSVDRGFCRLFWNDNFIIIAFRGTRESIDWRISNFKFLPTKLKNCGKENNINIHLGFHEALYYADKTTKLKSVDALFNHLEENNLLNDQRKIIITGHSLGAAIATLFSVKLRYRYKELVESNLEKIVLFGSPAVGFKSFKQFYGSLNIKTIRVINGLDVVPSITPIFFRHIGESIWFYNKSKYYNPDPLKRIIHMFKIPLGHFFKDHKMEKYIKVLKEHKSVKI